MLCMVIMMRISKLQLFIAIAKLMGNGEFELANEVMKIIKEYLSTESKGINCSGELHIHQESDQSLLKRIIPQLWQ